MTKHDGRGISVTGNATVSGQLATGDHVTQNQQVNGLAAGEAAEAFALVARLLDRHDRELAEPDRARARRDLADIREEMAAADTDDDRMRGALDRLARRVGAVAALGEAVRQLAAVTGFGD
ncbi:DUF5955 family protein [Actinomadura roseirufa]|uniref:DUF5955 family protein n=1 Tax=Actinomadura roseirufa TaxID=2094049 RepID=UPI00104183D8|nr:DUF5955 family protein [Actinomadura roseirufa]